MQTEEIKNYIAVTYDGLQIAEIPKTYISIYNITKSEDELVTKLNTLYAYWHYQVNEAFEDLNGYIKKNYSYYHADHSRKLLSIMSDIQQFVNHFEDTMFECQLDKDYKELFEQLSLLIQSRGTQIPEGFSIITLLYKPIFMQTHRYLEKRNVQQYKLHLIGEGAFANVFKYFDTEYKYTFALKRLKRGRSDKEKQRFRKEYELMRDNRYPYITNVYALNDAENSYTMEYCQFNLGKYIKKNNTKLSFSQRKGIAVQLLKGLRYLYNKGILHRDLSYGNILLQHYDDVIIVKISDFGLAKDEKDRITNTDSSLKGTLLDPCLKSFKAYDIQNEMYSLGMILWFIFTGKTNYEKNKTALSDIISKCISIDKPSRYKSVNTLLKELMQIRKLDEVPKYPINILNLKSKITDELASFSANELPEVCSSVGLKEGTVEEAFRSKRQYVDKRLHQYDISGCIDIVKAIEDKLGKRIDLYSSEQ